MRRHSLRRIKRLEEERDVAGLVDALENGQGSVAYRALEALGRFGDRSATEPVLRLLQSIDLDSPTSVEEADRAEWQWGLLAYLLGRVAEPGSPAAEELLRALEGSHVGAAESAMDALAAMGEPRAVEPLLRRLRDMVHASSSRDADAFYFVSRGLGELKVREAVDPLLSALEVEDFQEWAAEALGEIGDARAVPALAAMLDPKPRLWVGEAIANALDKIGTPEGKAAVAAWLEDDTPAPDEHEWRAVPLRPPSRFRRIRHWWLRRRSLAHFKPGRSQATMDQTNGPKGSGRLNAPER
jgi:HEAT repeat protein